MHTVPRSPTSSASSAPAPGDWANHQAIIETHLHFGRGLDDNDWSLYRSTLAEKITVDYSDATGHAPATVDADTWTEFVALAVAPQTTVHYYSNFLITVDGDTANVVLNHQSSHYVATASGSSEYIQRGTYRTRLALEGGWKLTHIWHRIAFASGNPGLAGAPSAALLQAEQRVFGA